jgi:WD40 repeat protein
MRFPALVLAAALLPAIIGNPAHAQWLQGADEAARVSLRPVCADPNVREKLVAKMIAEGYDRGNRGQGAAKWDLDLTCEQIELPMNPVHDTADPADTATHRDVINDAHWSPDGKLIVTAGGDKTVRIWDVATGRTVKLIDVATLPASKPAPVPGLVVAARFLDGGRSIVVAADGHPIRIFDLATGIAANEIPHPDPNWLRIATSANGLVMFEERGDIVAYDAKAKSERYRIPASRDGRVAISDGAGLLAIALPGERGHIRVQGFELETGKSVWSFDVKTTSDRDNMPGTIALSRDGRLLAVDIRELVLVYDVASKKPVTRIPHPYYSGMSLSFTADGKAIIWGRTHAMLTDIATGKRIRPFGPFSDLLHAADVSPDGKYLVTGHLLRSDGRIWEIGTGTFYRRLGKDVMR